MTGRLQAPDTAPSEPTWAAAVRALTSAPQVVLTCHVHPDGDALGSMLALGQGLRSLGIGVRCSWGAAGRLAVPAAYAQLPGLELLVEPGALPSAPGVLVALDTASSDRLGTLGPLVDRAGVVVVVDHHASNGGFGSIRVIDPAAAATAVLVEELLRRLGVPLTADIAACLYTGLTTDTGSFKHASTTPSVHELAARLLGTGIRHDVISRRIWDTNSFGYVQLLGRALLRCELEPVEAQGLGLVWTYTTTEDLTELGVDFEELEAVIDVLRSTAEAEVAMVVKSDRDGTRKVSTRSKGHLDVGAVCVALGGGGHRFAAGFTSGQDVPTTVDAVRKRLVDAPLLPG